jgi:hypothetical protein
MTKTATRTKMPNILSPKQIEARKFWRVADSLDDDRETLRRKLEAEVIAWQAAGNTITEVPIGMSGVKGNVFAAYIKGQINGLKKIKNPRKDSGEE